MSRAFQDGAREPNETAPTEAWLFAQAILGRPIPRIVSPEARARAKREELGRLAQSSSYHTEELRRLEAAEANARRDRELLEFAAKISTRAEAELRALQRKEAEEREAWRRAERFYERHVAEAFKYVEADHPRQAKGTPDGGQWIAKGGGGPSSGELASPLGDGIQHNRDVVARLGEPEVTAVAVSSSEKIGEHPPAQDPKAAYLRDFDKGHDLTLQSALKDGKLSVGDIGRLKFTDDEIKQILKSAEKTASEYNLTFYTAQNLPAALRTCLQIA